jgi:hypothetical protein
MGKFAGSITRERGQLKPLPQCRGFAMLRCQLCAAAALSGSWGDAG